MHCCYCYDCTRLLELVHEKIGGRGYLEMLPCRYACSCHGLQSQISTDPHLYACVGMDGNTKVQGTVSFRPVTPRTDYTSWASPKHFMYMCFPRTPHAKCVVPLRQCVRKRRLAKHFGACTVWTAAVGVVLLKSMPLKYRRPRMSYWNCHQGRRVATPSEEELFWGVGCNMQFHIFSTIREHPLERPTKS